MKKKKSGYSIGGCVWCDEIMVLFGVNRDDVLKAHVLNDCKKHPMRKLERKIKRLEKKR